MITRAEIIEVSDSKVKVRIPVLDSVEGAQQFVSDDDLSWASVLSIPGVTYQYRPGDIVVVGFENNYLGSPIVLGHLGSAMKKEERNIDINVSTISVSESAKFPTSIEVGTITYAQLKDAVDKA